jgi:hypothetical protein
MQRCCLYRSFIADDVIGKVHSSSERALPEQLRDLLEDTSIFRNRNLSELSQRLYNRICKSGAGLQDHHVLDVLDAITGAANAVICESNSLGVQMRDLWVLDGQKGSRAMRKKALTDAMKSINERGA